MTIALLSIEQVSKKFGGLNALSEVSLELQEGQIRGLIRPNGSGKTTLFNVVSGIYPLNGGRIFLGGTETTRKAAAEVSRLGIARTFQEIQLFYDMSVLENAMIGRHRLTTSKVMGALLRTAARGSSAVVGATSPLAPDPRRPATAAAYATGEYAMRQIADSIDVHYATASRSARHEE